MRKPFWCRAAAGLLSALLLLPLSGCGESPSGSQSSASETVSSEAPVESEETSSSEAEPESSESAPESGGEESSETEEEASTDLSETKPMDIGQLPHSEGDAYVLVRIVALPSRNDSDQKLNEGSYVTFEYDSTGKLLRKYIWEDEANQGLQMEFQYGNDGTATGFTKYRLDGTVKYTVEYGELEELDSDGLLAYHRISKKLDEDGKSAGRLEEWLDSNHTVLYCKSFDKTNSYDSYDSYDYEPTEETDAEYDSLGNLLTSTKRIAGSAGDVTTQYIFEYQWLADYGKTVE